MNTAWRREGDDLLLQIHAQPGAKQSAFAGLHGDALKVRLAAPAQDGRANDELRRFLADAFAVSLAAVVLLSGESARRKRLRIIGAQVLPAALPAAGVL
ncbi:MAG: DUF167 family protein [Pedobacter sp.]|nr:DUF167 family protein [Pedobacter sp.]